MNTLNLIKEWLPVVASAVTLIVAIAGVGWIIFRAGTIKEWATTMLKIIPLHEGRIDYLEKDVHTIKISIGLVKTLSANSPVALNETGKDIMVF
ncbi:hypothetical protein RsTz2092_03510 [Deferribacterales bacterium RsTz2092]|nr:hypothetical protein AGMMS49941_03720 [Deferribacterales bacterium]GHU84929.1 hypothetical protein AGMMS49941_03750 [Deferribacterales bacterium]